MVMTACGMRRSHSDAGNLGSVFSKLDKNYFYEFLYLVHRHFCGGWLEGITDTWSVFLIMDAFNSSDTSLYKTYSFGITTPLDNVLFMRDQAVFLFPASLLFNGSTKILLLSKL